MYANICTHDIGKSPDLAVTARHYAQCTQHCCLCFRPPLPLLASAWGQCSIHPSQTRIHMLIQHGLGAKNVALNSEWCKIRDSTCYMCVISIYPSICCFYLSFHICMQAFIYVCVCAYLLRLLDGSWNQLKLWTEVSCIAESPRWPTFQINKKTSMLNKKTNTSSKTELTWPHPQFITEYPTSNPKPAVGLTRSSGLCFRASTLTRSGTHLSVLVYCRSGWWLQPPLWMNVNGDHHTRQDGTNDFSGSLVQLWTIPFHVHKISLNIRHTMDS